ncbi:MAG: response regulator [Planctomyces sp.]|nr:response regulator [Planctomyces sp.]
MAAAERVLSIGQCGFDSSAIRRMFQDQFGADVDDADSEDEARSLLASRTYALVLVNRQLDADGSSGIDLIADLLADSPDTPMMLVSNFAEAHAEAQSRGARPGFGKRDLNAAATAALLRPYFRE